MDGHFTIGVSGKVAIRPLVLVDKTGVDFRRGKEGLIRIKRPVYVRLDTVYTFEEGFEDIRNWWYIS